MLNSMIENNSIMDMPKLCSSVKLLNLSYKCLIRNKSAGIRKKSQYSTKDSPKIRYVIEARGNKNKIIGAFFSGLLYKGWWRYKLKQ